MIYIATYVEVQPERANEGVTVIEAYGKSCRGEKGCLRTEALREIHRRHRFVVIEGWESAAAFADHENAEATLLFRREIKRIHKSPSDRREHSAFAVGPEPRAGALTVITHVDVPPPRREETEALLKSIVKGVRKEQGNLRFDIFQQTARPNHFTLVEEWRDDDAFAAHEASPATRQFRETLGPMLGALYDERLYGRI